MENNMDKIILIKYGELTTKKGNINYFINCLYKNINHKLKGLNVTIRREMTRMFIEFDNNDLDIIIEQLKHIFGIHAIVIGYKVDTDFESIKNKSLELISKKEFKTFKVETKRSYKAFNPNSLEMNKLIGGYLLKNLNDKKVDVHHPDLLLNIEIRKENTYIYFDEIKGLGGYPVGIQGKGLVMLSGGIDSPVAAYLALKRGIKIECIYFEAIPHTSIEARNKVINLVKKLTNYTDKIKLHIIPFTKLQEEIYKKVDPSYNITIMRRMMYRITEKVLKKQKNLVIINGESIGQVASQTLTSISIINEVTNRPIIRPVACLDKLEIIDIAKKIDTYDISILPFEDCCTIFVPEHPVINPKMDEVLEYEQRFNFDDLINNCVNNINTIVIEDKKDSTINDLL
jgi:tRNA uracil 4-sulfurtransferase